jgi:EpsI family protein
MKRRNYLFAGLMAASMLGAAYMAHALKPTQMLAEQLAPIALSTNIPKSFGYWHAEEAAANYVVNPQTKALIDSLYSETLVRTYIGQNGERIMLSIAYGKNQSDDKAVHYPEACYPAQGFAIASKQIVDISVGSQTIKAKRLVAKTSNRVEPITYWTTVGTQVTLTGLEHKKAQLVYGFKGVIPDGMIFRVSSLGADAGAQWQLQLKFLNDLAAAVPASIRPRLMGGA